MAEETIDPLIGKIFNQRYEVVKKIGKGAYGAVYVCRDHYLGSGIVALKILHPKALKAPDAARRLAKEIQAANRVDHENIVRFYDFMRLDGMCIIVMEYVDGPSLRAYINAMQPGNYQNIVEIARQICLGLQAIHNHEIIHRDLKPDNILITKEMVVKITDFGIASIMEEDDNGTYSQYRNQEGNVEGKKRIPLVGTMRYISPESIEFGQYDVRSDIYALGVILYEMIVGHYFFKYNDYNELMKKKISQDPEIPSKVLRTCPELLAKLCIKSLQRDPDNRYQSTDEMLEDIAQLRKQMGPLVYQKVDTNEIAEVIKAKKKKKKQMKFLAKCFIYFSIITSALLLLYGFFIYFENNRAQYEPVDPTERILMGTIAPPIKIVVTKEMLDIKD